VDAIALRAWNVHLLEPDGWELSAGVDYGAFGTATPGLVDVGHDGFPKRADGPDVKRVNGHFQHLHRSRGLGGRCPRWAEPEPVQGVGDAPRQLGVAPSHGVQRPGLDGQLNPIAAKVQAQVTVGVPPARRDHGGCHFGAMRE